MFEYGKPEENDLLKSASLNMTVLESLMTKGGICNGGQMDLIVPPKGQIYSSMVHTVNTD